MVWRQAIRIAATLLLTLTKRSRSGAIALGLAAALSAGGAWAQDNNDAPENVRDTDPDAVEVMATPLRDLNIDSKDIPQVLIAAVADPYDAKNLTDCGIIEDRIAELNAVLGEDIDIERDESDRLSTGRIARSIVGSFIPFRGILREVTGAAERKRDLEAAIFAGAVRRGYLKGLGHQRGCPYPARPAFARVEVKSQSQAKDEAAAPVAPEPAGPIIVSEPVIQPLPED